MEFWRKPLVEKGKKMVGRLPARAVPYVLSSLQHFARERPGGLKTYWFQMTSSAHFLLRPSEVLDRLSGFSLLFHVVWHPL